MAEIGSVLGPNHKHSLTADTDDPRMQISNIRIPLAWMLQRLEDRACCLVIADVDTVDKVSRVSCSSPRLFAFTTRARGGKFRYRRPCISTCKIPLLRLLFHNSANASHIVAGTCPVVRPTSPELICGLFSCLVCKHKQNQKYSTALSCTVARYGHPADLFFTPRAHVEVDVRTSSSTCARGV